MKMAFLAAAAMIATPLAAQTTPGSMPPASDPSTATAPTGQSTMTTPPATDPSMATPPAPAAPVDPAAAPAPSAPADPAATAQAPAPETGKLPWCRKGQYTACREHENAQGKGLSKT